MEAIECNDIEHRLTDSSLENRFEDPVDSVTAIPVQFAAVSWEMH